MIDAGQFKAIQTQIDTLSAEMGNRFDRLENRMDRLEGRMDRLEGRIDRFGANLPGLVAEAVIVALRAERE